MPFSLESDEQVASRLIASLAAGGETGKMIRRVLGAAAISNFVAEDLSGTNTVREMDAYDTDWNELT